MQSLDQNTASRNNSLMQLGKNDVIFLFFIYFMILVYSSYDLSTHLPLGDLSENLSESAIFKILISSSLGGSAIYYGRKLYKAGINGKYQFNPQGFTIERISTFAYFLMRIPLAVLLSIIIYCIWRVSLELAVSPKFSSEQSSKYLFVIIGFFAGFSAGKFISQFERDGPNLKFTGISNERN